MKLSKVVIVGVLKEQTPNTMLQVVVKMAKEYINER